MLLFLLSSIVSSTRIYKLSNPIFPFSSKTAPLCPSHHFLPPTPTPTLLFFSRFGQIAILTRAVHSNTYNFLQATSPQSWKSLSMKMALFISSALSKTARSIASAGQASKSQCWSSSMPSRCTRPSVLPRRKKRRPNTVVFSTGTTLFFIMEWKMSFPVTLISLHYLSLHDSLYNLRLSHLSSDEKREVYTISSP